MLLPISGWGQEYLVHQQRLTPENGLASAQVYQISQDQEGFIWMITRDGVNRFDGESFRVYTSASHGLRFNYYNRLLIDQLGKIWLIHCSVAIDQNIQGIDEVKIDILDPKSGQVETFDEYFEGQILENEIFFLENLKDYSVSIGDKQGRAYRYTDRLRLLFSFAEDKPMAFFPTKNHEFWIDQGATLCLYDSCLTLLQKEILPMSVQFLGETKNGTLLFQPQYLNENLSDIQPFWDVFCLQKGQPFQCMPIDLRLLHVKEIKYAPRILLDREDRLWVSPLYEDRMLIYDLEPNGKTDFSHPFVTIDLPFEMLNAYFDINNRGWICLSSLHGVSLVHVKKNSFTNYLGGQNISTRGVLALDDGSILVNSYQGLYFLDKNKKASQISKFAGMGLLEDRTGQIWSGLHHWKILKLDLETHQEKPYFVDPAYFAPKISLQTQTMYESRNGILWIGSDIGLYFKKTDSDTIFPWRNALQEMPLSNCNIRCIYENDEGLWLCTSLGLIQVDLQTGNLTKHDYLPIKDLTYLYEDKQGFFWIGSYNEGLVKWNRSHHQEFKHFTTKDGLTDNTIYTIYQDQNQYLWLPSNRGLMRLDPKQEEIISFHTSDGLPSEEFNGYSHFKDKKGNFYFGGLNGITVFHPDSLPLLNVGQQKPSVISYSELNYQTGTLEEKTNKLLQNHEIVLSPTSKTFQLQFACMDYDRLQKQGYAYRIKGFEKEWNYQRDNVIRINGLPSGNYLLEVKSQSSGKQTTANTFSIPLIVLKPYYRTWWFRITFLCASILLVIIIFRYRLYHLRKAKQHLEEEVLVRTLQIEADKVLIARQNQELRELNHTKDRLFALIGHELRGPFMHFQNIAGKLSYLINKGAFERAQKMGKNMDEATAKISSLLDNLLYWGLSQNGRLPHQPSEIDLTAISQQTVDLFRELAEAKGVILVNQLSEPVFIYADSQSVQIILRNLLSNALKFTREGGQIRLGVEKKEGTIEFFVQDTGVGMTEEQIQKVLDPQSLLTTQGTSGERGTGLGLQLCCILAERNNGTLFIESRVGEGSVFRIRLSRDISAYARSN